MTITRPNIRENKPGERSMPEVLFTGVCTGAVFMCWVEDISGAGCCTRFINYAVQVTRKYLRFSQNGTFGTKVPYLVVWCHKF